MNKEREKFEAWISSPPYEIDVERYTDDAGKYSWLGNYQLYPVQLAWCAWQERSLTPNPDHAGA